MSGACPPPMPSTWYAWIARPPIAATVSWSSHDSLIPSVCIAIWMSWASATVRLAEMVGYDRIRKLAIEAGMNKDLLATPALALGAYVATPLEIAGAYTVFANDGQYVGPRFILSVNDTSGRNQLETSEYRRQYLDS